LGEVGAGLPERHAADLGNQCAGGGGLTVLAVPIIRLLFQRGAFGAEDTAMMQPVLAVYALGLPVFSFVNLILRAF